MAKIFVILGKSATGKDTVYKRLLEEEALHLKRMIPYTTRPIRAGERNGKEYYFVSMDQLKDFRRKKMIIESRCYQTVYGDWFYFTVRDGQFNPQEESNYLMITTLEGYENLRNYYGKDIVKPLYLEVEDGIRLKRALKREEREKSPKYNEVCRRFLADEKDFREERLESLEIKKRYDTNDLNLCLEEIIDDIGKNM